MSSAVQTVLSQRSGLRLYRLLQWLIVIGFGAGLIYGWQILKNPQKFPIRTIKVEATYQHLPQNAIRQIIMPYVTQSFFNLKVSELKHSLSQIPWIAEVKVDRIWPDTVVVKITEQQAVARFGDIALLSNKGQLFKPPIATYPKNLPILTGKEDKIAKLWQYYQEINAILAPLHLSIRALDLNDRQSLSLILNNGMELILGSQHGLFRLQRFVRVYPQLFSSANVQAERVDLRYENGLSIKWHAANNTPTTP